MRIGHRQVYLSVDSVLPTPLQFLGTEALAQSAGAFVFLCCPADGSCGHSDNVKFTFDIRSAKWSGFVRNGLIQTGQPNDFQADDEGSIPFTRSNGFNAGSGAAFPRRS
jgi:hypothetical protein